MSFLRKNPVGIIIIFLGISLRFYFQFINWTFNVDEVWVGTNISQKSYLALLYPLDFFQSAPPLFLWLEKTFSFLGPNYISLKLVSFISSVTSLLLFSRIVRKGGNENVYILLLSIFAFNPFIIYHSLTLKQYNIDLCMSLIAVNYFIDQKNALKNYLFFTAWCLISNVGLFFTSGFIVSNLLAVISETKGMPFAVLIKEGIKRTLPYLFAPILYVAYFLWFMRQPGAVELKNFMVNYWKHSFLPLNSSIVSWFTSQMNEIYAFFFNSYIIIGVPLLLIFFIGFFSFVSTLRKPEDNLVKKAMKIYALSLAIHLLLSIGHLYPFSSRLCVYMAPFIYLAFGQGLISIFNYLSKRNVNAPLILKITSIALAVITVAGYMTYITYNENDIAPLLKKVATINDQKVLVTRKAMPRITEWVDFTGYKTEEFKSTLSKMGVFSLQDSAQNHNMYVISRQHNKFGHSSKRSPPESEVVDLLKSHKEASTFSVHGYTMYKIN